MTWDLHSQQCLIIMITMWLGQVMIFTTKWLRHINELEDHVWPNRGKYEHIKKNKNMDGNKEYN